MKSWWIVVRYEGGGEEWVGPFHNLMGFVWTCEVILRLQLQVVAAKVRFWKVVRSLVERR